MRAQRVQSDGSQSAQHSAHGELPTPPDAQGVQLHVRQHTGEGTYRETARHGMELVAITLESVGDASAPSTPLT